MNISCLRQMLEGMHKLLKFEKRGRSVWLAWWRRWHPNSIPCPDSLDIQESSQPPGLPHASALSPAVQWPPESACHRIHIISLLTPKQTLTKARLKPWAGIIWALICGNADSQRGETTCQMDVPIYVCPPSLMPHLQWCHSIPRG